MGLICHECDQEFDPEGNAQCEGCCNAFCSRCMGDQNGYLTDREIYERDRYAELSDVADQMKYNDDKAVIRAEMDHVTASFE